MKHISSLGGRALLLVLALALVLGGVLGGTLAWLSARTAPVTNTFTTSDIDITLEESDGLDLKMVPGCTVTKDPKVTVAAGSEACYLFVKLEKSANFDAFMTNTVADGWTALDGVDGVYYRTVAAADMGTAYSVLKDDQVTVKDTVTKEMMNALTDATRPTLTVTAYAAQMMKNNTESFTAAEAWANVNPTA